MAEAKKTTTKKTTTTKATVEKDTKKATTAKTTAAKSTATKTAAKKTEAVPKADTAKTTAAKTSATKATAKKTETAAKAAIDNTIVKTEAVTETKPVSTEKPVSATIPPLPTKADKKATLDAIQEKIDKMQDPDTKILAELLLELKKDQEEESAYAKRHMIYSIITSVVAIGIALACVFILIPQIMSSLKNVNVVLDNTNKIIVESETIVT